MNVLGNLSEDEKTLEYDGWIVEFKEEPLAVKNKELEQSNVASADKKQILNEHKEKIRIQRDSFKNKLKVVSPKTKVRREFDTVFNGLSINKPLFALSPPGLT
jgi:exonuclease I